MKPARKQPVGKKKKKSPGVSGNEAVTSPVTLAADKKTISLLNSRPMTARRLLEGFEIVAVRLEEFFKTNSETLDEKQMERIRVVMTKCHNMLALKAAECDWKAVAALADQGRIACEVLHDLSQLPVHSEVVKTVAATHPQWPVWLSPQKSSFFAAKEYLRRIGVGTASNPPTASINATPEMRYRQCASDLIDKIESYRDFLTHIPDSPVLQGIRLRAENLPKAKNWEKLILPLPPRDKKEETCNIWWGVAEQMLDVTPLIDADIEKKAEADARKPESYATKAVKKTFYKLFLK